jgi:hypothetical protein
MQRIKLHARGIVHSDRREVADRRAQRVHTRDNPELRDERESKHQADEHVSHGEDMRSAVCEAIVKQRTSQKYQRGNNANPMKFAESAANKVSGEMCVGQNLKRCCARTNAKKISPPIQAISDSSMRQRRKDIARGL